MEVLDDRKSQLTGLDRPAALVALRVVVSAPGLSARRPRRPLNEMLSAPWRARVGVPTGRLRVQRFAWARASFALGARQIWPLRSPGVERKIVICSFATAESVK